MTTTHPDGRLERTRHDPLTPEVRERLRTVAPVLVAVLLLFGVAMAGFFALGEVLDLGVWLVSAD
ncbi:hypothetical protein [Actinotalea sp. Marseille-Q4924]|uniref:hypothetical protein n=1 Tax=Actinotalea sp. Marseille-Q4924 TaxID=2866571 RepID=UPI001CE3CD06|nr:hypothetical protein [Actinotalea sp. Marseille-Q4924]